MRTLRSAAARPFNWKSRLSLTSERRPWWRGGGVSRSGRGRAARSPAWTGSPSPPPPAPASRPPPAIIQRNEERNNAHKSVAKECDVKRVNNKLFSNQQNSGETNLVRAIFSHVNLTIDCNIKVIIITCYQCYAYFSLKLLKTRLIKYLNTLR